VDSPQRYFAYGSNMATTQMRERCPSAANPLPAVLADHDWLINDRGVATIEPAAGRSVHGVVWELAVCDLVALDRFEGAPRRYARTTVTVTTAAGAVEAEVYVDPRVEPGPARPAYLEGIIAAAAEHALPDRWQQSLARWGLPFPTQLDEPVSPAPATLAELLQRPGVCEEVMLRSAFGFMAIHGGALEAMTDVIARRAADAAGASCYAVIHPDAERHHLSSTLFRPAESEALAGFLEHVEVVVSVHGYGRRGRWTQMLAGGTNRDLAIHVAAHVAAALPGYDIVTDLDAIPSALRGMRVDNPVNLPSAGGVQLELPPRVRGQSPRSPLPGHDGLSPVTHDLIGALAAAAASWPLGD